MRLRSSVLLVVAVFAMSCSLDQANSAPRRQATKAQQKIDPTKALALMREVNRYNESENLAVACSRSNFKGLSYALTLNSSWLNSNKREFETSEEFADRSEKVANVMADTPIVVCQPLNENEDAPFEYEADLEQFVGSLSPNQNVWRDVKQLGRFNAKTMMGVPFTVSASSEMNFEAAFEIQSHRKGCLVSEKYGNVRRYRVPVPRTDAPNLKSSGYLVYIARLKAPYVETDSRHDTASLDDPYEIISESITVHAVVERLAVVDGRGKEWWNCNPLKGPGALPPQPIGNTNEWVRPSDYVAYSWRPAAKGDVGIELKVSSYGYVVSCDVTASSGNPELDRETCYSAKTRAKFQAATDALGNDVDGVYPMKIHWGD